ncbi:MAG TPA: hypothetical protein DHW10_01140, partial [Rhodospirillaceae bacterium]|nr:hypothetical protein [Rhodospirillaceae bacterium]
MCIAGFGLATAALGGCASTGHEVPYTGDTFPTFHGAYNQSASSPYSTLSFADSMLDHFFRMNPAGSPGRLELARLVRQNTVDVYVPTTQFYTNDRGEVTRQSIRRASVWNPDTQEPLKITREGGFYILAHQSNDENLDGFPAFAALTEGRHVQPAAQMRLSKPYEIQKCETTG